MNWVFANMPDPEDLQRRIDKAVAGNPLASEALALFPARKDRATSQMGKVLERQLYQARVRKEFERIATRRLALYLYECMKKEFPSMREEDIIHEAGDYWVGRERNSYTVFKNVGTYSVSDSAYAKTEDGKSIAIARCEYLAKRDAKRAEEKANG